MWQGAEAASGKYPPQVTEGHPTVIPGGSAICRDVKSRASGEGEQFHGNLDLKQAFSVFSHGREQRGTTHFPVCFCAEGCAMAIAKTTPKAREALASETFTHLPFFSWFHRSSSILPVNVILPILILHQGEPGTPANCRAISLEVRRSA